MPFKGKLDRRIDVEGEMNLVQQVPKVVHEGWLIGPVDHVFAKDQQYRLDLDGDNQPFYEIWITEVRPNRVIFRTVS